MATTTTKTLSPAQHAARKANALKATGPTTDEGKARSSRNALAHGLCSTAPVLPGEDPVEFEGMLARGIKQQQAVTDEECLLVYNMCCAVVAMDRVRRADAAATRDRLEAAGAAFDAARRSSLIALNHSVAPATLAGLLARPDGVRWLIAEWRSIDNRLAADGHLGPYWTDKMVRLLGGDRGDFADERTREVLGLDMPLEVACGAMTENHARYLRAGVVVDDDRPLERLRAIVAAELEALHAILPDLEAAAAERRRQALDAALVDTSDAGARRHRYLQDHQRTFRQLSAALSAAKAARLKLSGLAARVPDAPDRAPAAAAPRAPQAAPRDEPKGGIISSCDSTSVGNPVPSPARLVTKLLSSWTSRPTAAVPGVV